MILPDGTGPDGTGRLPALDLIRGVAVLGILAVNITGFAGPIAATTSPNLPAPGSSADVATYLAVFVVFEGKLRGLFSLLFGASMLLFVECAEAAGRAGAAVQMRRLGWLAVFGYVHYLLLWWGDILFIYAVCGALALALRRLDVRAQVTLALMIFAAWHVAGSIGAALAAQREASVVAGTASVQTAQDYRARQAALVRTTAHETAGYRTGFTAQVRAKAGGAPFWPVGMALNNSGEVLPMMLLGMALLRTGFFAGGWPRAALRRIAIWGIGAGGTLTALLALWLWHRGFPPDATRGAGYLFSAFPRLAMVIGYAAALMLAVPRLLGTAPGAALSAAGRMAFTNYLGTSLVMCAIFYGWGLDLVGHVPRAAQMLFVLGGWVLMLAWSKPWLARFRQGPLEWLWRSLTEGRVLPLRR